MSLLHPWALGLAGLVAVPVLLHLMRRESVQHVAFPALRYLRNAEIRTARSMRLRDLLLLAARVALIVLLAVAASRPLAGRGGAGDHAPTDVILLIDNTASMNRVRDGRTLLDLQVDAARATLEHASPADRFWVVPAAGPPLAAGVGVQEARRALDSVTSTDADARLVERIAGATAAVPVEEEREREVHLYTDLQMSGFRGGPLDLSSWGRLAVSAVPVEDHENGYVAALRLEPGGPVVPGDPSSVAVRIRTSTADAARAGEADAARAGEADAARAGEADDTGGDTVEVRLIVDDKTVAMARAAPGSEVLLALPDLEPGPHTVRVETPPSGLRGDDSRQIGVVAEAAPAVTHAGPAGGFVASALAALSADGRIREASASGAEADPVTVAEGSAGSVPAGEGAIILIPPAELTRLPAFQQEISALGVPWRLEARAGQGALQLQEAGVPGLSDTRVLTAYGLERLAAPATADDSVLLRTNDGAPWLVRGRAGDRIYLLLASPMRAAATDLPVGVAMIPFMEHMLTRWSRPSSGPARAVEAGATVALPPRIEGLRSPAGTTEPAEGGAFWTPLHAGMWKYVLPGAADDAGVDSIRPVGVNVPAGESDVRLASEDALHAAFAGTDVELATSADAWADAVFLSRRGAEATPWIVGMIILLALVELLLAAPRRAGRSAPEAVA